MGRDRKMLRGMPQAKQQVKLFKGVESDLNEIERRVNEFLSEQAASIVSLTGNIAPQSSAADNHKLATGYVPSDVLLILVYEPKASL